MMMDAHRIDIHFKDLRKVGDRARRAQERIGGKRPVWLKEQIEDWKGHRDAVDEE